MTMVSILEAALDVIPERRALKDGVDRIRQPPGPEGPKLSTSDLLEEVADQVAAGGGLPADLGQRWLDAATFVERNKAAHAAWQQLRQTLKNRLENVEQAGADKALDYLGQELSRLLAEVRDVLGALGSARSAEEAIAAGPRATAAWSTYADLLDRYDRVRAAQYEVMERATGGVQGPEFRNLVETVGVHRNYAVLEPETAIREGRLMPLTPSGQAPFPTSWPREPDAFLRWLATSPDASPWVPTMREFREAEDARKELRRSAENDRARGGLSPKQLAERQEKAMADYDRRLKITRFRAVANADRVNRVDL